MNYFGSVSRLKSIGASIMKIPNPETIRISAIAYLRDIGSQEEADILSRCKLEIGDTGQRYTGSTQIGLILTLRCRASDVAKFEDQESAFGFPSSIHMSIQQAIGNVLPAELKVHNLSARSILVDRNEFDKTELERLIEAQIDLMIAVATGGPKIQLKNEEYKDRRQFIREKLKAIGKDDPNSFGDLWDWYGRWRSGDLPTYQSRRDYIRSLYRPLLEDFVCAASSPNSAEPSREPTGWEKVDRIVDKIIVRLSQAKDTEEYQAVGLMP